MKKKCLYLATLTDHIKAFHIPYLRWFKEQGWEVHVATYGDDEIPYCDKKYNIAIQRSPFRLKNIKAYYQLKNVLKSENYDIIHGHTPMGGVLTRLCGKRHRKHGTKVIYTAHGFHFYRGASLLNWLLYYPIEKWLSKYTDVLITMNKEDYDFAQLKMKAKKICYISGIGIDTDKFANLTIDRETKRRKLGIPTEAIVLISVGELSKRKNQQVAIKAVSKLKLNNLYYVICGQGNLKDNLVNLCKELNIENHVLFLGYRSDTVDLLHMSDVFMFPSLQEGLPVALMEAMAAGLPCIVSRIRGNVDLIENKKGGLLCNVSNEGEYSIAINTIVENYEFKHDMSEYNKNVVQKFDIKVVMEQMEKIYREVLN